MLDDIYHILLSYGLITGSTLLTHKVNFYSNVNGFFSIENNKFVQVKVAIEKSLENEYKGLTDHNKVKQVIIPKVICFCERNGYKYLVVEGVSHQMISSELITAKENVISGQLLKYFSEISYLTNETDCQSIEKIFSDCSKKYSNDIHEVKPWIKEKKYELFNRIARRPQHCDFTINNIAFQSNRIVIFDWEDYGEVDIEGFDIVIFICSICEFKVEKLQMLWSNEKSPYTKLLIAFFEQYEISMSDLWSLLPGYLLLFYQLKCELGYSNKIRGLSKNLISKIISCS